MTTDGGVGEVLTVSEAARFLRIGKRTLQMLTKRGEIRCRKMGRRVVYLLRVLRAYLEDEVQPGV